MIYVVRHGQTDWNLEGRFQGRIDIPLNEKGKSQAKKTKEKLEGIKFDKVFSSPLKRALETAKIITDEPIDIDDRIIERCNGQLEGKLKTECENMVDFTDENEVKLGIESLPDFRGRITSFFDELCEKSDIISLHCPLTPETEHIINKKSLDKMKEGVIIINCSRGGLINTYDLIAELSTGKIGGVGLDVYEHEEDYFLMDMSGSYKRDKNLSLLISMPNVIITAHQAFFTSEALNKIASDTCQNIKDIFETGTCQNELKGE